MSALDCFASHPDDDTRSAVYATAEADFRARAGQLVIFLRDLFRSRLFQVAFVTEVRTRFWDHLWPDDRQEIVAAENSKYPLKWWAIMKFLRMAAMAPSREAIDGAIA